MRLGKVHPDLKLEATFALVVGIIAALSSLFLFFWGFVLVGILTGYLTGPMSGQLPSSFLGWLVPFTSFLVAGFLLFLGRYLLITYPGWLYRATWLVRHAQPRKMALSFQESHEAPGRMVELREPDRADHPVPGQALEIRSPQWKLKGIGPSVMDVYQEFDPEGIMVLASPNGLLWGFRR
jgi:hypothetical protein